MQFEQMWRIPEKLETQGTQDEETNTKQYVLDPLEQTNTKQYVLDTTRANKHKTICVGYHQSKQTQNNMCWTPLEQTNTKQYVLDTTISKQTQIT